MAECCYSVLQPFTCAVTKLEWVSPLEIIKYPDPRLRAVNARIGVFDESLERLGRDLLDAMYQT